jgi:hypothetical protein
MDDERLKHRGTPLTKEFFEELLERAMYIWGIFCIAKIKILLYYMG